MNSQKTTMPVTDLTLAIVGSGGDGSITCGELIIQAAAKAGLFGLMVKSFGPQIRGGESSARIRLNTKRFRSQGDKLDVLAVFSWPDFVRFKDELELKPGCIILHDESKLENDEPLPLTTHEDMQIISVPFSELAKEAAGTELAKNMVMTGCLCGMFNLPYSALQEALTKKFAKKGEDVLQNNLAALTAGFNYANENNTCTSCPKLDYDPAPSQLVMTGNDAMALGAVSAGCSFFAGYPITPSTEIMEQLAKILPSNGGEFVQTEDEIAALNMVIGASFAGKKAMTATSGPGLSLMQEAIGLSSIAELPAVIVDVQRVGPSTGIPTKSEQSDLMAAIHGSHGDAPKAVIAPFDVEHGFHIMRKAFAISEKYQIPVIVLADQFIGHRQETIPDEGWELPVVENRLQATNEELSEYKRYRLSGTGVSASTNLGTLSGQYLASGIEHEENGKPTSSHHIHELMNAKRYKKLEGVCKDFSEVIRFGSADANIGLIGWGSTYGVLEEAVDRANRLGIASAGLVIEMLYPLPEKEIQEFIDEMDQIIVVELSHSAQFYQHIKANVNTHTPIKSYARGGAKHLTIEEICRQISEASNTELVK